MSAIAKLFGGGAPKMPAIPKPEPVAVMPSAQSKEALEARRRAIAVRGKERGRESTNLTGADTYINSYLGQ